MFPGFAEAFIVKIATGSFSRTFCMMYHGAWCLQS